MCWKARERRWPCPGKPPWSRAMRGSIRRKRRRPRKRWKKFAIPVCPAHSERNSPPTFFLPSTDGSRALPSHWHRFHSRLHCAFYAKSKASRGSAVHLQIIHVGIREQFFQHRLEAAIVHVFLPAQPTPRRIRFDGAWAVAQLCGHAPLFRVTLAALRVDIYRAGLGQRFLNGKAIVGEEDAPLSRGDQAQAVAAGRTVFTHLYVRWESVNRCFLGSAHLLRNFRFHGDDAKSLHTLSPSVWSGRNRYRP